MAELSSKHSDPTLLALEELRQTLRPDATPDERSKWWNIVLRVQSAIERDHRASQMDHAAMRRLRDQISEIYSAINGGHHPHYSGAMVAITGVQSLLEARTTGFDGQRLR